MKFNLKVRIKNKVFWLALIPALILFIESVLGLFGIEIDLGFLEGKLLSVVESAFVLLAIFGIVVDPTTPGASDSERAMTYDEPGKTKEGP